MQRETNSGDKRLLSFGQKINRLMTTRNQCILFVLTFVMDAVSIFDAATDFFRNRSVLRYMLLQLSDLY